jgi:hypothetical protein
LRCCRLARISCAAPLTRAAIPNPKDFRMANGFYVASFPFPEIPEGEARMVVELRDGLVHTTHDVNGPTRIEMTDFFSFKRIDLAA